MCDWTDSSTLHRSSASATYAYAGPHPKLERDLQQEVEGGRQLLTYHARGRAHGASETSFTFESSRERFITFVNDAEFAILSIGQCIVVMNIKYLHVKINNL